MSARQLARLTGISKTTILRIEQNEVDPKLSTIIAIANALNVLVIDLFEEG